jgi:prepilin signal peptidase PulO-like enzyme (type II secretory pathway)
MVYFWSVLWFFVGTVLGSFLNVLALRYHPESSIFSKKNSAGRSHCLHCKKKLRVWELIPVFSFLYLRGKCATCGKKLTWQYPVIEFLSGFLVAFSWYHISDWFRISIETGILGLAPWWFYVLGIILILEILTLLLIAVIDFHHYLIPNELVVFLSVLGLGGLFTLYFGNIPNFTSSWAGNYEMVFAPFKNLFIDRVFAVLALGVPFFLLSLFTNGRGMGWGDFKLSLALGLMLGFVAGTLSIILAFAIGGIFGLLVLLFKFRKIGQILPFAPFLVLGCLLAIFFGRAIISSYFGLFLG